MNVINYKIRLEPDFGRFDFRGLTNVEIRSLEEIEQVVLHANELEIHSCRVKRGEIDLECTVAPAPERQEVTVAFPQALDGSIELVIDYTGQINDQYAGLYKSEYEHDGQKKYLATTQFEATDARRAFPCFDHPSQKATFEVEFLIDQHLTGISNAAILEQIPQQDGKKLVRFERTPKMSTYLVFFGIGEFEFIEDDSAFPLVRVATVPGRTRYADFALEMARKTLAFCIEYTGIDYPMSKCDYIAVPDSRGAMENYGAIRHAEDVLLVYPGVTSRSRMVLIAKIIMHEGSHLWFGDLVSPSDWKYLWLNESFATYFTYEIPDYYYPEWKLWDQFLEKRVLSAMERDSLLETVPIELPDQQNAIAELGPTPSTAPIVYNKGAAVIRMLAAYLGEDELKKGIHHFLDKYKFDCATSQQCWDALEQATGEPLGKFADSWIYQAGYPIVAASRDGGELRLAQKRFTFSAAQSDRLWLVPIDVLLYRENGETQHTQVLLEEKTAVVSIPADTLAFKLNGGQMGFYRVEYEEDALNVLGRLIERKTLSPVDSFGVQNDLFALVKGGRYSLDDYLSFVETYCGDEDRYVPLLDITKNLIELHLVLESEREVISHLGKKIVENALEGIGLDPRDDDDLHVSHLRDVLLWAAFVFASEKVTEFAKARFREILDGKPVHQDILPSVLKIGAVVSDQALDHFERVVLSADTPEVERVLILSAMGYFQDKTTLQTALEINLTQVPKPNRLYMIHAATRNPTATKWMWQWFLDHFEHLMELHLSQVGRVIVSVVPVCGLGKQDEVRQFLDGFARDHEAVQDIVQMALESLEVYARLG